MVTWNFGSFDFNLLQSKYVVLFFYPLDFTFVCPTEITAFSDRYEEFKKGRYREFYQYGVELIGATGPLVEAEVIALAINMLTEAGLKNWELRIGHVGVLKQVLTGIGLSEVSESGEPPLASAMRFLDKEDFDGLILIDIWLLTSRCQPTLFFCRLFSRLFCRLLGTNLCPIFFCVS